MTWTKEKIEHEYANGRRDFSGEDFSGLNLNGINLRWAYLIGTNLSGVTLRKANLSGVNLTEADLTRTDLRGANLSGVTLRRADMTGADLRWADMTGANIDYSCWPLWCGSLGVKVDKKIAVQLAYHLCSLDCDDGEYVEVRKGLLEFANQMHRRDVKRLE
jgi:hypothetical protein